MLILSIETTGEICSVAVCDNSSLKAMLLTWTHRDLLIRLPELTQSALKAANCQLKDISLVAVSIGPGSFTSTRIGVAYAKAMAYSLSKPITGIRTLECIAHLACVSDGRRLVVLYPSRPTRPLEAYSATFVRAHGELETLQSERIVDVEILLNELISSDVPTIICGALRDEWRRLLSNVVASRSFICAAHVLPTAEGIGQLARLRWEKEKHGDDIFQLKPLYVLPSQAEEKFGIRVT
ncbi:MAG: tRNA (adenosine(37)-N6)-threonylcarbamoyltransferase complex dimerization subunit type 1 TsaB [Armatimonadota bacterium]|nr:tRNA (adenosine(37)-N6)-threonylcarbamoyltransferase complex dimerization subunit type 1 TsaB [Armatimonadota bacterium]MCX7777113.1 tRNA (adenosine(37)-N6)-threonylcarbamoyltransferase complex dimerization subunit type 1 TsaB [Armatimonadota bacterium]MDW8025160.1 tRNA (adenosine(37)-N6)-threonylcarbamoyltransferase complex dimerization subunit type 1 TsaB [Armatimonadota bacterium]